MYIGNQRTRHQIRAELIRKMEQLKVSTKQCERLMLEQQIAQLEKEAFKAFEGN